MTTDLEIEFLTKKYSDVAFNRIANPELNTSQIRKLNVAYNELTQIIKKSRESAARLYVSTEDLKNYILEESTAFEPSTIVSIVIRRIRNNGFHPY